MKRLIGHRFGVGIQDGSAGPPINPYLPGTGWNVQFDAGAIGSALTEIECYHIALDGPIGSSAVLLLDGFEWDYIQQGWANGWDPSQPMLLTQTMTVTLCWTVAATAPPYNRTNNIQPRVTLWLRHELAPPVEPLPGLGAVMA